MKDEDNNIQNAFDNNDLNNSNLKINKDTEEIIYDKLLKFKESKKYLQKDLNLTSLAHYLNTNPKYLSQLIKNKENKTFREYINHLRIRYITKRLLEDEKLREYKISYLAEHCGYSSSQVFVIAFKKETGMTPSNFLKQLNLDEKEAI